MTQTDRRTILQKFLGEELTYQIGFWLFSRCGEARTRLLKTGHPGLYRASLEGRTVGFMDWLLGRYRYSYVSYLKLSTEGDRLQPFRFEFYKKHMGHVAQRSVTFDYSGKELIFSGTTYDGKREQEREPMQEGIIYEDYLTLFYNFRHGIYGPLERGRTYLLPLRIHKGTKSLELSIVPREEEERHRWEESNKAGKEFFLRFRVNREDVSSMSGKIEGWLTREGIPTKGTIRDVIFFGDLWGVLIHRQMVGAPDHVGQNHEVRI